jgi:hypothetical protein
MLPERSNMKTSSTGMLVAAAVELAHAASPSWPLLLPEPVPPSPKMLPLEDPLLPPELLPEPLLPEPLPPLPLPLPPLLPPKPEPFPPVPPHAAKGTQTAAHTARAASRFPFMVLEG